MRLSIIIPVYNEAKTIKTVLQVVRSASLPHGWERELLVVDDGSTDGTRQVLSALGGIDQLIFRETNGGKGAALKDGFRAATGDYLLIQDADLEYDPSDYERLLQPIVAGEAEVVFGSRVLGRNNVPFRKLYFYGGLVLTKLFNWSFGGRLTDLATCYKVFPRRLVPKVISESAEDFVFDVVQLSYGLVRHSLVKEIPIHYQPRSLAEGKKINWRHGWRCGWEVIRLFLEEKKYLKSLLVFTGLLALFSLVYFSVPTLSSGDDHYFHFRFAAEMREQGFLDSFRTFKSIYLSKMAHGGPYLVYYNFLFYLLILPFTYLEPLFLGIKLYAVMAAAIAFTALYWAVERVGTRRPFMVTFGALALTSYASWWRFFLSRPYTLAPVLLIVLLVFLYRRQYWRVALVSFIYLYWHSATFFFPVLVGGVYLIFEKFYRAPFNYRSFSAILGGVGGAMISSYLFAPGLIAYFTDTMFGVYWETIIGKKIMLAEGGELYPINLFDYLAAHPLLFALLAAVVGAEIYRYMAFRRHWSTEEHYYLHLPPDRQYLQSALAFLCLSFFLGTVVVSARFGDYLVFFGIFYLALAADTLIRFVKVDRLIRGGLVVGSVVAVIYLLTTNLIFLQQMISRGSRVDEFRGVGEWLMSHTQPGEVVFNANWSWFPQLYYHSPQNYYLTGLEPRFSYTYSPTLYWLYDHIGREGIVCKEEKCDDKIATRRQALRTEAGAKAWYQTEGVVVASALKNELKTRYVITSRGYSWFNQLMAQSDHFEQKFVDRERGYFIYQVK